MDYVIYGWLSLPWFILKLPLMFSLILHTHLSAYNSEGHCVAYANTKERDENREARLKNMVITIAAHCTVVVVLVNQIFK